MFQIRKTGTFRNTMVSLVFISVILGGCDALDPDDGMNSLNIPNNSAQGVSFTDLDTDEKEIQGNVNIVKAGNETDVTLYILYWGTSATSKYNTTPLATAAKIAANLSITLSEDTIIPDGATHLLVFTANDDGEMEWGISYPITDVIFPTHPAKSLLFTDNDPDASELAGATIIEKAETEEHITHYVLYWGKNEAAKLSNTPIARIVKTGNDLNYTFPQDTLFPDEATHILVYTQNDYGEMEIGISITIHDKKLPTHATQGISFTDIDSEKDELQGDIIITKASDESDVTEYVLYWGTNATNKYDITPLGSAAKTGANLIIKLSEDTLIPDDVTHLLIFTKNDDGEMEWGIGHAITDVVFPTHTAKSLLFTDNDPDANELAGVTIIEKAESEDYITHYVLYWGKNEVAKLSNTPIAKILKTGNDLNYTFPQDTLLTDEVTHILAYTQNNYGEMEIGVSLRVDDKTVPVHAPQGISFTDIDQENDELQGNLVVIQATDESDVTEYVLYWGMENATKLGNVPIVTYAKTGNNISHTFSQNTSVPAGARRFLAFTANEDGEREPGISIAIKDLGLPVNTAGYLSFSDTDPDENQIGGNVIIAKSSDEYDITYYVLYWGNSALSKQNSIPIATIAKTGNNLTHTFPADTTIPASATHLLVYTKNNIGEMSSGKNTTLSDMTQAKLNAVLTIINNLLLN